MGGCCRRGPGRFGTGSFRKPPSGASPDAQVRFTTGPAVQNSIRECGSAGRPGPHHDLRPPRPTARTEKLMSRQRKTTRERMSEWVLHCAVNQRHIRRSQPTREAALKDACSQLLEGHAVNRIVGPNETITAERVKDWCAKHRSSSKRQSPN